MNIIHTMSKKEILIREIPKTTLDRIYPKFFLSEKSRRTKIRSHLHSDYVSDFIFTGSSKPFIKSGSSFIVDSQKLDWEFYLYDGEDTIVTKVCSFLLLFDDDADDEPYEFTGRFIYKGGCGGSWNGYMCSDHSFSYDIFRMKNIFRFPEHFSSQEIGILTKGVR